MISQLAAAAGKKGGAANSALSPNASALLQYLRQVGAAANMSVAAQILATGVIPPGAIPPKAAGSPKTPGSRGGSPATLAPGSPLAKAVTPSPMTPGSALGKRSLDDGTDGQEAKRQKV